MKQTFPVIVVLALASIVLCAPGCALFQKQEPDIWNAKVMAAIDAVESSVKAFPDSEDKTNLLAAIVAFREKTQAADATYDQLDTLFDAVEAYIATMLDGDSKQQAQGAIAAARVIVALATANAPPK